MLPSLPLPHIRTLHVPDEAQIMAQNPAGNHQAAPANNGTLTECASLKVLPNQKWLGITAL